MTRCVVIVSDSGGFSAIRDAVNGDASETHTIGSAAARVGGATLATRDRKACGLRLSGSGGKGTIVGHGKMATIHTDVPFPTYRGGFPPAQLAGLAAGGGVTLGKIGETLDGDAVARRCIAYDDEAMERTFGTTRYSDSGFFVDVNQTAHPSSDPTTTVQA